MIQTNPAVDPVQLFRQILENTDSLELLPNPPWSYINREISLLNFHARVLEEAQDPETPLLERVKFLSIFGSNMDEFFMVRVSRVRKQMEEKSGGKSPDGSTPRQQSAMIRKKVLGLLKQAQACYTGLLPDLDKASIRILDYKDLTGKQRLKTTEYFDNIIFPVLTPLGLDLSHPFPHISNLSLNFAVVMQDKEGVDKFVRLKVPGNLPALLLVKSTSRTAKKANPRPHYCFVWLEQVILANLKRLFPGMKAIKAYPFRLIRDSDIDVEQIEAEGLLESMQQGLQQRKFGQVVMVSIYKSMPKKVRAVLMENLGISPADLYALRGPLGLSGLYRVYEDTERFDLKYPPFEADVPRPFRDGSGPGEIFKAIRKENILLHHPYDSFMPVVDFLHAAAIDPNVIAIKQTLYRVGQNSPVIDALIEAAERGKQVVVLVELKARFDEASNIEWSRKLELAGAHVIYGVMGLKTHVKAGLVVRKEEDGMRGYLHLATGNYNSVTANIYEDVGLFTCDETLVSDVTHLFNYLTGYSTIQDYRKLMVAPVNLRQRLQALILREVEHAENGRKGHVIIKANSLVDPGMIQSLYEASQAGVKIDLIIRGTCCLVPGVANLSENIRVISVVSRFLEHSRIFYFYNDEEEEIFLGSADLMTRNLNYRMETVFPIEDKRHIRYLRDQVLEPFLRDNTTARILLPDGTYQRKQPAAGEPEVDVQKWLMQYPRENLFS